MINCKQIVNQRKVPMTKVRRLYEQFRPSHYDLYINPDKSKMIFNGTVKIKGRKIGRPSQRITLHAKDLTITKIDLVRSDKTGSRKIIVSRMVEHKSYDELRIHTEELLYPGEYQISIEFRGQITKPMNGLYPCFYQDDNKEEIILATQFESHHAREVFPCIDEPEAKAIFELTLTSPIGEIVLANTEPSEQSEKDAVVTTTFMPSPKMSTYLLAFVIGRIGCLEKTTKAGVKVRSYASPMHVAFTDFALDTAVKCLDLYNEYFGIDYPLSKCDLVALPDFSSGAMENWGLITFREQALLVDPVNTSLGMKQYIANVVAHELTHQWFGNLVTMRWWNDLWLNESFATLMSYLAIDKLFPDWKVWSQFIADEQSLAMKLDSLVNTHPINVEINHPDEIRTIFDNISYEKGASVLLMLMHFLGEDNFRKGLNVYLTRHSYSNSQSVDLWKAWEEVANLPIANFMSAWTEQPGYPLLKANVDKKLVELEQTRFYLNPKAEKKACLWPLPVFSDLIDKQKMLDKGSNKLAYQAKDNQPLLINQDHTAFYRTIYDKNHLKLLKKYIEEGKLRELDRQGILADSFEAAKAGYSPTTDSLKLLEAYSQEDNVNVWDIIGSIFSSIRSVMDDEDLRQTINPVICKFVAKQYIRLGWERKTSDSHFDLLLRPMILGLACTSEDSDAISEAKERFISRDEKLIDPDIRGVIYTTIARNGGQEEFNQLLKIHNDSTNSEERVTISAALTNFKQPVLIESALGLITSKDVRLQDTSYWISYSLANRYAQKLTWEWLKSHWEWLKDNIGNDLSFYMMPRYVARSCSDETFIPEFKAFFNEHMSDGFVRPVNQAIETITWQSEWKKRDLASIKQYYKA